MLTYRLLMFSKVGCEWSPWGECDATCLGNGTTPETSNGTKTRSVKIDGMTCDDVTEQECQKDCPGKMIRVGMNVIFE